jgi:acetolactate synthase-1/2/3 large subunit
MVGMPGHYGPNKLTNECDLLIAIGMRFDDRVTGKLDTYAKQAKVIHFDIDPAEIDKNVVVDVPVLGNVKNTLSNILDLVDKNNHKNWVAKFNDYYKVEEKEI